MPLAQFRVLNHFARLGGERPMARSWRRPSR
jgi:hypothetical protein